jgi:hypothetical protein
MGKITDAYKKKFCQRGRRLKGREHLGNLVIDGRV